MKLASRTLSSMESLHLDPDESERSVREQIVATIRELLKAHDMSQNQLGKHLNIDPANISRILRNLDGSREFKATEIARMAVLFNVPAGFFFGDDVETAWQETMQRARQRHSTKMASLPLRPQRQEVP